MKIIYLSFLSCLLLSFRPALAADTNAASASVADEGKFSGKVLETTNVSTYTYVLVDTNGKKCWAVSTRFPVKPGDNVTVIGGMPMTGFHSKSLNRDFDVIYFTGRIVVAGSDSVAMPALPPGHPALPGAATAPKLDLSGIKRAEDGKTVQEIYAAKASLAGTTISVRGKVVKYNAMILGKNWLHIQDGSGTAADKNNDLTVTTSTPAVVGDTVLVTGAVSTDKDFGAGYKYDVMIQDAKVTIE